VEHSKPDSKPNKPLLASDTTTQQATVSTIDAPDRAQKRTAENNVDTATF
jgi:hypothetical protein